MATKGLGLHLRLPVVPLPASFPAGKGGTFKSGSSQRSCCRGISLSKLLHNQL